MFMLQFDDAVISGNTLIVDKFSYAYGGPPSDLLYRQGFNGSLPVTAVAVRVNISSFDPKVFYKTLSGSAVIAYQFPIVDSNPANFGKPLYWVDAVISGTFTGMGQVAIQ